MCDEKGPNQLPIALFLLCCLVFGNLLMSCGCELLGMEQGSPADDALGPLPLIYIIDTYFLRIYLKFKLIFEYRRATWSQH